jgi:hypothetical protein
MINVVYSLYGLIAYLTMLWRGPSVVREFVSDVKVKVVLRLTVCRSVRLGIRHPPGTRDQFFPFSIFLTVSGLLMWGSLSDEKSGQCISVFAGNRQRSLSQI